MTALIFAAAMVTANAAWSAMALVAVGGFLMGYMAGKNK